MLNGKVWVTIIVSVAYLMQDSESHLFYHIIKIFNQIFYFYLFLAVALRCWKCASDASNTQFCGRNLDSKNLTKEQKSTTYVECTTPHNFHPFNAKGEEVVHKCEVYKQLSKFTQCVSNTDIVSGYRSLYQLRSC